MVKLQDYSKTRGLIRGNKTCYIVTLTCYLLLNYSRGRDNEVAGAVITK